MKKVIKLTENELVRLVNRVINEQKKFELIVTQGSDAEASLKDNVVTITTEMGRVQKFKVKTSLPEGKFLFHYGKDGKYYGFNPKTNKKTEIIFLEKIK
jgi:hypothetical protein